jgi:hypothetical protein
MFYSRSANGFYTAEIHGENIPSDAVEITAKEYRALIEGQSQGKRITADENSAPFLAEMDTASIAGRRTSAKQTIDTAAGNARGRYVSVGQMVEEEYRLALQQVKDWRAAGSPAANVPAAISDWAIASGMTDEQAATDIEQTAAYWDQVLLNIRQIRLSGKAAVDNATDLGTHDDMQNVAQPYIDQLNLMQP